MAVRAWRSRSADRPSSGPSRSSPRPGAPSRRQTSELRSSRRSFAYLPGGDVGPDSTRDVSTLTATSAMWQSCTAPARQSTVGNTARPAAHDVRLAACSQPLAVFQAVRNRQSMGRSIAAAWSGGMFDDQGATPRRRPFRGAAESCIDSPRRPARKLNETLVGACRERSRAD